MYPGPAEPDYPTLAGADDGSGGEDSPSTGAAGSPSGDIQNLIARWFHSPELFAWEVFGLRLWSKQRLICRLVARTAREPVRIAVASGHKTGKALALDTPLPTPTGWTTMGEVKVGDQVFDEEGGPCRVIAATEVMVGRPCYDVEFSDGTVITADAEHQWQVERAGAPVPLLFTTVGLEEALAAGGCYVVRNPTTVRCPDTGRTFHGLRAIVAVTPRASIPVRCIQVDSPSSLYLASKAFIPTHNSKMLAVIAIWFAVTRPAGRVIITAPTARQIRDTLWREVTALYKAAMKPGALLDRAGLAGLGGKLNQMPDAGLRFPDGSEVVGFSTNSPERMAGTSGEHLLYLIDEASGVEQAIYDAIEGNRAGDASVVMFSNPTRTSGYFFEAFHGRNKLYWHRVTISSEDTPNAISGKKIVPGLATRAYIDEKRVEWGPEAQNDPRYQVRILGKFPRTAINQIVPLYLIEKGKEVWYKFAAETLKRPDLGTDSGHWKDIIRSVDEFQTVRAKWARAAAGPLSLGVDPAWMGDDQTAIYVRRGFHVIDHKLLSHGEGKDVRDAVINLVRKYRLGPDERPKVRIDALGVGAAAVERLREEPEVSLIEINSSKSASKKEDYRNLRTEILFAAARFLQMGGGFEPDPELERDLGAPTYVINVAGQFEADPKRAIKKKLGRSPDRGDAFSLCAYDSLITSQRVLSVERYLPKTNDPDTVLRDFGERTRGF